MSDAEIAREKLKAAMKRLAEGDRSALEFIYQATSAKLFGICLRILGERSEAEDALQDVYVNLWQRADRYDPDRASPISWLATFARNRAIDRLRSGKVQRGAVPVDEAAEIRDDAPLADDALEDKQRDAKIHHCLGTLEERQQDAIRTTFFKGTTYAELAQARGLMASDPDFAAEVADWEERLSHLQASQVPVEPGPELWSRIESEIAGGALAEGTDDNVVSLRLNGTIEYD